MKTFHRLIFFAVTVSICSLLLCFAVKAQDTKPDNGTGAFATGKYVNLFAQRGHSRKEIDEKINKAFNQLFFGNPDSEAVYFQAGKNDKGPLSYVSDVAHHDIRSEGMSYGMMIAVQLNRQDVFNSIWNYAMTRMYISDLNHPSEGYFSWSLKRDGTPNEETPAPDGEEYFVMSLYFASGRWGNGAGIYNYHAWADKLLANMRHHKIVSGITRFGPRKIGPMVNEERKMILFVPGIPTNTFTDPSYHLPAFYELWARWGPKQDRAFWLEAADSSRAFFVKAANAQTGLVSDYTHFDGKPYATGFNKNSVDFSFDSWRAASNWSVDWEWWHKAKPEQVLSNRIQGFFIAKGIATYGCQFTPDGKQLDDRHASGLIATNAVTSLAATDDQRGLFIDALWNAPVPQVLVERYYDGLLYIMSLLHCSGNFKIYAPR